MFDGLQDAPVPVTTEPSYRDVPDRIHGLRKSAWCPEIGNSTGKRLLQLRGKAVAVDPSFRLAEIGRDLLKGGERLHRAQLPATPCWRGPAATLAARVGFASIDGLHVLQVLLRDLINTARLCASRRVIALRDLVPTTSIEAERDKNCKKRTVWADDVCDVIPVLREYRSNLD